MTVTDLKIIGLKMHYCNSISKRLKNLSESFEVFKVSSKAFNIFDFNIFDFNIFDFNIFDLYLQFQYL